MIEIVVAPPFATVQDLGRPGYRAQGVPISGAMDPIALAAANAIVGNPVDAAVLEWAAGPIDVRFVDERRVALTGAVPPAQAARATVRGGIVLAIGAPMRGRFMYLAIEGGIDVPLVLGSRSTYLAGRFGGHEGRLLRKGDTLPLGASVSTSPGNRAALSQRIGPTRVIRGPHRAMFSDDQWHQFLATEFAVAPASDRTGYRLTGTVEGAMNLGLLPSEPMCPGAIQITTSGQPIVLMRDAPTIGGYPVIAVVHSADLPALAQRGAGDTVRFREITLD